MSIEKINYWLARDYGYLGGDDTKPLWRISYSDSEFELRKTDYDDRGNRLIAPEVRLLPKYKQWLHNQYILERLLPVPDMQLNELTVKISYEPVWAFKPGQEVRYDACQFLITRVYKQAAEKVGKKYIDPEEESGPVTNEKEWLEVKKKRMNDLHEYLFGNETDINTQLAHGEGVSLAGPRFGGN